MPRASILRLFAIVLLAAAGLTLMSRLGTLQLPTVLAYSGMVTLVCGVLSVLLPPRWLGFSKRIEGLAIGTILGAALFAAGWFWPARSFHTPVPVSRLDAFMPEYNFHERHEAIIQASPDRVRAALDQISFADLGVMQTLGRIRNAAMGVRTPAGSSSTPTPIVQMVKGPRSGFFQLDDTPREFVFGLAGQPWNNKGVRLNAEEFRRWAPPGNVKIAANFLIEDVGGGRSRVVTETRVFASDDVARRKMAKYWTLIYPGSGLVRRAMLDAVRCRAEQP